MNKTIVFCCIFFVLLFSACTYTHLVSHDGKYYPLEDQKEEKKALDELIQPYKLKLDAEMNTVIGTVDQLLLKEQPESSLGNWAADVVFAQAQKYSGQPVDFAVLNYGGLRIPSLPKGGLSKGKIFELMPFDNRIVVVEMKGEELKDLFNHIAQKGGWPVSAAVRMRFDDEFAVKSILLEGEQIQTNKIYKVATIDYLANGGDKCSFFVGKKRTETGKFMRTAIIEYVEALTSKGQTINATVEGRIQKEKS